jgi:hypothetical protein
MVTAANSILLPPDLYSTVKRFSEATSLSVDSVAETALRYYFDTDPELDRIRDLHLARANALGLTPDDYVDKLVHEARAERRQSNP